MRVLVLGASGASGVRIAERALAAGHEVTAFVRDPARLDGDERLAVAVGDVLDPATLSAAIPGHDAVVWAVGGLDTVRSALPRRRVSTASARSGRGISSMRWRRPASGASWASPPGGAGDSASRVPPFQRRVLFPLLLREELEDKTEQERLLRLSGCDWTIVRPTRLTDAPGTRRYLVAPALAFSATSHIARADVADFVVRELCERRYLRQVVQISA